MVNASDIGRVAEASPKLCLYHHFLQLVSVSLARLSDVHALTACTNKSTTLSRHHVGNEYRAQSST